MGRKRKSDEMSPAGESAKNSKAKGGKSQGIKKEKKAAGFKRSHSDDEDMDDMLPQVHEIKEEFLEGIELPPKEVMSQLLDNIEAELPKEDHVKYDSRVKKLNWDKIKIDGYTGEQCRNLWLYVQNRIRRFRILAELIPDAKLWIQQPWTNFYKSKDHNRHPDMPKKPLSMYMLFYSEKREQILREQPNLSMPEVAKICSEQYSKLTQKKKDKYKQRCDEMRKAYEEKLAAFYREHPELKPVKPEKVKKPKVNQTAATNNGEAAGAVVQQQIHHQQQPQIQQQPQQLQQQQYQPQPPTAAQAAAMQGLPCNNQSQMITIGTGQQQQMINIMPLQQDPMYTVVTSQPAQVQQQQPQQQARPMTSMPPASVLAQAGMPMQTHPQLPTQPTPPQQVVAQQQQVGAYPTAPEKPAKPFDLFFKHTMDAQASSDSNFDRQSYAEKARQEWKTMKVKKKAKWIKKAADHFREYEEKVVEFIAKNPGYVRPQQKNFLTQEDQRILDKYMGRPEKPPSSAYSLFSKEMLNNVEIKKFPSKERMAQISEKWKILPQEQKDCYQAEVNRSMGVYRQKYEDWFNNLNEAERKAETSRLNSTKTVRNKGSATAAAKQNAQAQAQQHHQQQQQQQQQQQLVQQQQIIQEPTIVNVPSNMTPAGPAFSLTPIMMPTQPVQLQVQPVNNMPVVAVGGGGAAAGGQAAGGKDREKLLQDILNREPVEPARSPRQLFITEWLSKHKKKKPADAKGAWKSLDKKEKKKWQEKLEPQRVKYIEDYTVFVRGLDKDELEMYTELKQKRDEEEEGQNDSSDSDSDTSDSEDSESESESDSED